MRLMMPIGLVLLAFAGVASAATYHVTPDGAGDFPTIQAAILGSSDGDVIELADGAYTGDGNRRIDFSGRAVTLRSASGNPAACIIDIQANPDDEHYGIQFISGEGPDSRVEGVTIARGMDITGC